MRTGLDYSENANKNKHFFFFSHRTKQASSASPLWRLSAWVREMLFGNTNWWNFKQNRTSGAIILQNSLGI